MFRLVHEYIEPTTPKPLKTVKDLDVFDDVWIEEEGIVYYGWVYEISRRHITVVYDNALRDYKFQIVKPLTNDKIEQDNKILYCNEPKRDNESNEDSIRNT